MIQWQKGSGTDYTTTRIRGRSSSHPHTYRLDYKIFIKTLRDNYNIFGVKLQAEFEE